MATISGIVSEVSARPTQYGDMYDIVVNGVKYGHGKYPPRDVRAGDFVTFDYEEKQNGKYINRNIVAKSLRKESGLPQSAPWAPAPTAAPAPAASSYSARVPVVDKRQETISKQSAMNTGLTLLGLHLQYGAVKVPAKAADAFTLINTMLADIVSRVYEANTGEQWELTAEDFAGGAKPVAKAPASEQFVEDELPGNL